MENLMILAVEKALENQITEAQVKVNQTVQVTVLAMVSLIMVNLITMEVVRVLVMVNQMTTKDPENQTMAVLETVNQMVPVTDLAMVNLTMMEVVRALVTVNQMVPVTDLAMVNQITTRDLENQITAVLDMENQMVLEKESLTMMRDQLMTMTL